MVRPDYLEANPTIATAVARAISRGGALFLTHPEAAKAALRSHRLYTKDKLADDVFDLSHAMVASAMPAWGTMSAEGWQKVLNFAAGAGMLKEPSKAPSAQEGVLSGRISMLAKRRKGCFERSYWISGSWNLRMSYSVELIPIKPLVARV